jgi:hypothetical protein
MSINLTGGIDLDREEVFAAEPENPDMRDSVSCWISDDEGYFGIPRIGIEAEGRPWDRHLYQAQMGFADGRIYLNHGLGETHPALDQQGRPYVIGAGPLEFRCLEPFARWSSSFHGEMIATSAEELTRTPKSLVTGELVPVEFEVEITMAVPPWVQGSLLPEAKAQLEGEVEGDLMGGPRYEQLFRCEGRVRVDGEEHGFRGQGLRIRRQGVRELAEFWGHAWQSAVFPSGRAFGYITYPPRADAKPTFNEGYLYDGSGELIPARVLEAPWLRRLLPAGEDVSVVLETERGITRIEGESVISVFDILKPQWPDFPPLQQAGIRYRWEGEETYGMLERSSLKELIEWPSS